MLACSGQVLPPAPAGLSSGFRIGAVCGPSQPTQRCVITNNDAGQRRVLPLVSVASVAWTSALLGLPEDLVDLKDHALAGLAGLRDGRPRAPRRLGKVGRSVASPRPPEGYHTAARGQCQTRHTPVVLRAAPGLPCGRAGARSTRRHTAPARKIINDPAAPLATGRKH
jgi:hypothetical protein